MSQYPEWHSENDPVGGTHIAITNQSQISGDVNTIFIRMDMEEFNTAFNNWRNGMLIQQAFPNLDVDVREFLMTGITPLEWDRMFPSEDSVNTQYAEFIDDMFYDIGDDGYYDLSEYKG